MSWTEKSEAVKMAMKINVGKPKKRWLDAIENYRQQVYMKIMSIGGLGRGWWTSK